VDEVAREYSRQQEDKRALSAVPDRDINGMTSRVTTVEGSIARLEQKIKRQHSCLEGLLREMLGSPSIKSNPAVQRIPEPQTILPETSMATTIRAALASEPCACVSLKDVDKVDVTPADSEMLQTIPSAVEGMNKNVDGAGEMDAVPMDIEGLTDSVEDVVNSVGGIEVGGDPPRPGSAVYDMHDVTIVDAPLPNVPNGEDEVCITSS